MVEVTQLREDFLLTVGQVTRLMASTEYFNSVYINGES